MDKKWRNDYLIEWNRLMDWLWFDWMDRKRIDEGVKDGVMEGGTDLERVVSKGRTNQVM